MSNIQLLLAIAVLGQTWLDDCRANYRAIPAAERAYYRYAIDPPQLAEWGGVNWTAALSFAVCSCSREVYLQHQIPLHVSSRVSRLDMRALGWNPFDFIEVMNRRGKTFGRRYPYSDSENPLYVRTDWLIWTLSDASENDAYFRLMVGGRSIPKTRDQFLKLFEVDTDAVRRLKLDYGHVERNSGVAVQNIRVLQAFSRLGGYAWGTLDFAEINRRNNPLRNIDLQVKHDAEEWIVGVPKSWSGANGTRGRGNLQVYVLANGSGNIQTEAPVKIAKDHTRFKGIDSIRFPGSCHQCHTEGLNEPNVNGLRKWLESGVELKTLDYDKREFIERWHLTDTARAIRRANEDFGSAVLACTGLSAIENARNYKAAINDYGQPLTLRRAAGELACTPRELSSALIYANVAGLDVGGTLLALSLDADTIHRREWEDSYLLVRDYLIEWKKERLR